MEIKNEKEAKQIICDILGKNLVRLSVSSFGRRLYADVQYTDYKPERVVRSEIEEAIPNLIVECISRDYSPEHIVEALVEDQTPIYIESIGGRLDKTTSGAYVYELLMEKDFTKQEGHGDKK